MNRKTLVQICDIIVTLPRDVKEEDEKKFFQAVYDYFEKDFGEQNIMNAVVHYDEGGAPHMHLMVLPTIPINLEELKEKGMERKINMINEWLKDHPEGKEMLNANIKINRQYYQNLHPSLSKFVEERLGYPTEIMNGATANGNKTVLELKNQKLKFECEKLEKKLAEYQQMISHIQTEIAENHLGFNSQYVDFYTLIKKNRELRDEIDSYKKILIQNGYTDSIIDTVSYAIEKSEYGQKHLELLGDSIQEMYNSGRMMLVDTDFATTKGAKVLEIHSTMREDYNRELLEKFECVKPYLDKENPSELILLHENGENIILFPTSSTGETVELLQQLKDRGMKEFCDERSSIGLCPISNDHYMITERILGQARFFTRFFVNEDYARMKIEQDYGNEMFDLMEDDLMKSEFGSSEEGKNSFERWKKEKDKIRAERDEKGIQVKDEYLKKDIWYKPYRQQEDIR